MAAAVPLGCVLGAPALSSAPMDAEILIAGSGPAGAAAAIILARAGRSVLLVERESGPREKVCGEFLGADAMACLCALGLDPAALGAVPITEAAIARRGGAARMALPFSACGLPRATLDEALLGLAVEAGVTVRRGHAVRDAGRDHGGWSLRLADGAVVRVRHLVLATGKHAMRGFPRVGTQDGWIGAKLHLRLRVPLAAVTLLPFAGGYAGLQPSAGGDANLCAALDPGQASASRDAAGFMALVAAGSELAASLLDGAEPRMARPLTVAGVPYGFLHRDALDADATLWRVGDQFAVIPSFLGDGIAMALAGGMAAADTMLAGRTAPEFHAAWRRRLVRPMRIAAIANLTLRRAPGFFAGVIAHAPGLARRVAERTRVLEGGRPSRADTPARVA